MQYECTSTGFYQIDDLKQSLRDAINKNADVLTKFHDAEN